MGVVLSSISITYNSHVGGLLLLLALISILLSLKIVMTD